MKIATMVEVKTIRLKNKEHNKTEKPSSVQVEDNAVNSGEIKIVEIQNEIIYEYVIKTNLFVHPSNMKKVRNKNVSLVNENNDGIKNKETNENKNKPSSGDNEIYQKDQIKQTPEQKRAIIRFTIFYSKSKFL